MQSIRTEGVAAERVEALAGGAEAARARLETIALSRWAATPASRHTERYRYEVMPLASRPSNLSAAVSALTSNPAYQALEEHQRAELLQELVWFVEDRWGGWRASPHADLIVQALRETDLWLDLSYRYMLCIADVSLVNTRILEQAPLSTDLLRVRNHLEPGEMVICIPKNGVVGVASASLQERRIDLIDVAEKSYHIGHQYYVDVGAKMRRLADLEEEMDALQRSRMFVSGASRAVTGILEYKRRLQETAWHEFQIAYDLYEDHASRIVAALIEQHQAQAFQVRRRTQTLTLVDPEALAELLREYQGDLGRMEADGYEEAGFLRIGWLLRRIRQQVGAMPATVMVKISASFGKTYLQLVYDSFHKAGIAGFEDPVTFIVLETANRTSPARLFQREQPDAHAPGAAEPAVPYVVEPSYDWPAASVASHGEELRAEQLQRQTARFGGLFLRGAGGRPGTHLARLEQALDEAATFEDARRVALELVALGEQGARSVIRSLETPRRVVIEAAATVLAYAGTEVLLPLVEALAERPEEARAPLYAIIARIGEPAVWPLLAMLSSSDTYRRLAVMTALELLAEQQLPIPWGEVKEQAISGIVDGLFHPDRAVQQASELCVRRLGVQALQTLVHRLEVSEGPSSAAIGRALAALGAPAVAPLVWLLDSPSQALALKAAATLVIVGAPALAGLAEVLRSGSEQQRVLAARTSRLIERQQRVELQPYDRHVAIGD